MLAYDVVEQNPSTNKWETRDIVKPGPTVLMTTSTRSLAHQLGTRVLERSISDSQDQTRAVTLAHATQVLPRRRRRRRDSVCRTPALAEPGG